MQLEQPQADYNGTPQTEDGYTRIANELLDAILVFPFSKREMLIVFAVIRKTYGYNKKMDDISLSQLRLITGVNDAHLSRSIRDLVSMNVLLKEQGKHAQSIGLNKKYRQWMPLPKEQPPCQKSKSTLAESASLPLPKEQVQKTTPKDNTKRQGIVLPDWLSPDDWKDFKAHRKAIKKPMSEQAENRMISALRGFHESGYSVKQILDTSIVNGWAGVFEPKHKTNDDFSDVLR